ncbi:hypothetical protein NCCP2222_28540 [Sporosarcina sp. NCCP-2222]|uniref:RNA polymerase sigma factor n=1 Tax=Sporosarcina sp. NCCP-2222 TaxID=2935073 RepID=UPI00208B5E7E|nr:hypothetical protein [Sporosarcina sp. NCCP-2222]GKV56907.1 hypothetical protein NCCP2222_28540 [Sporosarcina sp. NCCP-2222]
MEERTERLMQLARQVEQMAIQFGMSPEAAGEWTETFFQAYHAQNGMQADLDLAPVLRGVYEQLSENNPSPTTGFLTFEEDNELFERLTDLPVEMKSVLLFSRFQMLSVDEIARITGLPEGTIVELEREGLASFDDPLIEKKLSLLHKSLERLRPSFRFEQLYQVQSVVNPVRQKKQVKHKKTIYLWVAGLLSLAVISYFWIISSDEYKAASSAKLIAKLETSFEKEFQDRLDLSGLAPLIEKDPMMINYLYNKDIRKEFDMFIFNLNYTLEKKGVIDKKEALKQYDEFIDEIKLPSEIAEELFAHPLTNNLKESERFLERYLMRLMQMQAGYMYLVSSTEYAELVQLEELQDGEVYMPQEDTISDELKNVIKGMESQNIYLTSINGSYPTPLLGTNEYSDRISRFLHPDCVVYIKLPQYDFYKALDTPDQSLGKLVNYLEEMENLLLKTERKEEASQHLYGAYTWVFINIMGEGGHNAIGADSRVKQEYREAWKRIASLGSDSPSASIMSRVVQEMEEDGWFYSPYYEELKANGIYLTLDQAVSQFSKRPE